MFLCTSSAPGAADDDVGVLVSSSFSSSRGRPAADGCLPIGNMNDREGCSLQPIYRERERHEWHSSPLCFRVLWDLPYSLRTTVVHTREQLHSTYMVHTPYSTV